MFSIISFHFQCFRIRFLYTNTKAPKDSQTTIPHVDPGEAKLSFPLVSAFISSSRGEVNLLYFGDLWPNVVLKSRKTRSRLLGYTDVFIFAYQQPLVKEENKLEKSQNSYRLCPPLAKSNLPLDFRETDHVPVVRKFPSNSCTSNFFAQSDSFTLFNELQKLHRRFQT